MKKVFLFNGPPRCGKDTIFKILQEFIPDAYHYKMAYPLKDSCHKMLGLLGDLENLEGLKESHIQLDVTESFNNQNTCNNIPKQLQVEDNKITLRQFYIHMSENFMKPTFGQQVFGQLAVSHLKNIDKEIIGISDCGFKSEIEPLIDCIGPSKFVLVRIYRDGKDFSLDSRSYIQLDNVSSYDVQNNGSIDDLRNMLELILKKENLDICL